jgi:hypothetical protein
MALQKQPISINFSQGLNLKSDPYQIPIGQFSAMTNSVFNASGRLTKRNGYANLTALPNDLQTTLTTLNDNLIATGSNLYAFSEETDQWLNQGNVQPIQLSTLPLVRVSTSQTSPDMGVATNGLACLAYEDNSVAYYQVSDSITGQQIIPRTSLGAASSNARVFILGQYFIVTYLQTITSNLHLRYIAIPIQLPTAPLAAVDIGTGLPANPGYDGAIANNTLYIGWAANGGNLNISILTQHLVLSSPAVVAGHTANLMSLTTDTSASTAAVWMSIWDSSSTNGYTMAFNQNLATILTPTQIITTTAINEITSIANNQVLTVFYENAHTYGSGPNSSVKTDYISTVTCTQSGSVSATTIILRSVGLASKAFIAPSGTIYMVATFGSTNQNTYFLIDSLGNVYMRLAYGNGGGWEASQVLPNVSFTGGYYYIPYLITDYLATVNKGSTSGGTGTPLNAIYTQTGVNLAKFGINTSGQYSSEIAGALHLTGGQLWEYDGVRPVEFDFQVWPEPVGVTSSTSGGLLTAQEYFYQVTYEWTDNAGNLHRSAPSIPISITTTGSTSSNTLYIPTLRLTYKVAPNPVRIVIYRWSVAQQIYYQITSIAAPLLNDTTVDLVTYVDTLADSAILGNVIIYTTGGVIEDIAPPPSIHSALFNNRLWLIDAEDPNLLWFSKQVIENTPVEMSDLLTIYVAPTSGAQGSTGPMTALSAMDDKLIIFKKDAIYYVNGIGPDNTGANSQFSDPVFITAAVGCANPDSIVLTPNGLMFQSDKGIWLLGRGLDTTYIGAAVEAFNNQQVLSAQSIPATNQVRFTLGNNVTLMYDYFYNQWGTFTNVFAISATLYQGFHTYLNSYGSIYQETPGTYVDGSKPVLMSVTTGWINVAGLQGYERFYQMFLLGTYYTPFKLNVSLAYDYLSSNLQQTVVAPDNFEPAWGGQPVWGAPPAWGGPGDVFEARVFPQKQKCESFQVSIQEVYDGTMGANTSQGLTLSGLNLLVGVKKGTRTQSAAKSFG